jgi:NAD(P)-dependent dehydrogenase (short-subunit alcohol dehydrogenase family)
LFCSVKYLGKQNGFSGGSYLNLTSSVELQPGRVGGCAGCSVLGTTRALGLARSVARHGVRTTTVYQPTIDYPDLNMAAQITDDQHTPYNTWSRYRARTAEKNGIGTNRTGTDIRRSGTILHIGEQQFL